MGLPRHDGEIEGVVMEDDAVLVLGIRGRITDRNVEILSSVSPSLV